MRGFGITGVDFAIKARRDKVADVVGMNPIDLRILNAYRDGDRPRAALPAFTATDDAGRVQGFKATNHARKGARRRDLPGAPPSQPPRQETPAGAAVMPTASLSVTPPPATPPRSGAMRSSSLSGFRRC